MKSLIYFIILLSITLNAQVGIDTTSPNAQLDIRSTNQATPTNKDGLLIPKIDEYPVTNPTALQDGMLVFATGDGSVVKGFYYWDNTASNWIVTGKTTGLEKITENGQIGWRFVGRNPSNYGDIGIGAIDLSYNDGSSTTRGATGENSLATGKRTIASGVFSTALGGLTTATGNYSTAMGNNSKAESYGQTSVGMYNTVVAGSTTNFVATDRLFVIGNGINSSNKSDAMVVLKNGNTTINGRLEVQKTTDTSITVKSPFGNKSSIKLVETNGTDYGFEFEYDGSADRLNLWSRTFSGNEAERMTWLKNGNVGISTTAPNALLDVSSSNPAAPKNTDGMLVPRISAFPTTNPGANQNGMLVFLTTDNKFYYWRNSTTSWASVDGVQKINDLSDGKSDNDGTNNGSSIFLGIDAGNTDDSSDNRNVGIGYKALQANNNGSTNTALGYQSMKTNSSGFSNVALGTESLFLNTGGNSNTALGDTALYSNNLGDKNIAIGWESLKNNTSGNGNIAIGNRAGINNIEGGGNVFIGHNSGGTISHQTNKLFIDNSGSPFPLIYGDFDNDFLRVNGDFEVIHEAGTTHGLTIARGYFGDSWRFLTNSSGHLVMYANNNIRGVFSNASGVYSAISDRNLKKNINSLNSVLNKINKLKVVDYNFIDQKTEDKHVGFIAQEVKKVFPHLVNEPIKEGDDNGHYTMDYSGFGVIAIKAIQEQQIQIEALKKEIQEIKALLLKK